ncbi:MAG: arsenate reductase (glutaredoxin) [Pseudohongiella sp.]|uniref:arsenate reductase (glutaredoxin) n=1 Tax=Pseudohongiella sp. TaxID=1979412 RepID=UPI00349FE60A
MSNVVIYHNPRCSKSRQTLALLQARGIEPEQVLYLETPPQPAELRRLLKLLNIPARQLLRKGEAEFKELKLMDDTLGENSLIEAMSEHPRLIERPIVVYGDKAVIGRPPEKVLELIP